MHVPPCRVANIRFLSHDERSLPVSGLARHGSQRKINPLPGDAPCSSLQAFQLRLRQSSFLSSLISTRGDRPCGLANHMESRTPTSSLATSQLRLSRYWRQSQGQGRDQNLLTYSSRVPRDEAQNGFHRTPSPGPEEEEGGRPAFSQPYLRRIFLSSYCSQPAASTSRAC